MSGINTTKLGQVLGDKAQDPDVKKDFLYGMFYNPKIENRIEVITDVIDEIPIPNALINDPLAPLKNTANVVYKDDVIVPDAEVLKVQDCILAIKLIPVDLWKTYLGVMKKEEYKARQLGKDFFAIPFEDWFMQKLREKAAEKLYLMATFRGVRDEDGTDSTALFDGFLKKITDATSGLTPALTETITGAITATNVLEKAQLLVDSLSEGVKDDIINVHMTAQHFDWLHRLYNPVVQGGIVATDQAAMSIPKRVDMLNIFGTNAVAHREPGMGVTNRMIATQPNNLFLGFNSDPNSIEFEIQKVDLTLKVLLYFRAGTEIGLKSDAHGALRVSDLATDNGGGEGE